MSIGSFFAKIFHSATMQEIEDVAITAGQHAAALFAATPEGAALVSTLKAFTDPTMTTEQKFAAGVEAATPELLKIAADPALVLADMESLAREVVQTVFDAELSTTAGKAATAIITALSPKAAAALAGE